MTKNLSLEPKCLSSNPSSATQLWGTAIFSSVKSQKPLTLGCQGRGGGGITCEGLSGTCGPEGVGSNRYGLVFSYYFLPITSWFCFFFNFFKSSPKNIFFIAYREGEGRKRNSNCLPVVRIQTGDQSCNLGMCPDQEPNWGPFSYGMMLEPTAPHWPGLSWVFKNV